MRRHNFILISILIFPFIGCSEHPGNDVPKLTVEQARFEEVEDDVQPPPPHLISKFATVKNWLVNICDSDKPPKPISKFQVGLFEAENDFTLFLVGTNTYEESQNRSMTQIDFEPANMYFKLPQQYYKNIDREKVLNQLTLQLKEFSKTEKFKNSFLAKSKEIVFTNGELIWSNL